MGSGRSTAGRLQEGSASDDTIGDGELDITHSQMEDEQANPALPNGIASTEPGTLRSPRQGFGRSDEFCCRLQVGYVVPKTFPYGDPFGPQIIKDIHGCTCMLSIMRYTQRGSGSAG